MIFSLNGNLFAQEEELRVLQEKKWDPVIEWFNKRFGVNQQISQNLELPPIASETRAVLARHLLSYDFPALNGMLQLIILFYVIIIMKSYYLNFVI